MALPASGAISLSQVSTELGRASTATTSLGETAVRGLAGVASGAISMSNLWGKSAGATIFLSNQTVTAYNEDGAASAQYRLTSAGVINSIYTDFGATVTGNLGNWITPQTNMANYECLATTVSGTFTLNAGTGTWLNLGTTRTWGRTRGSATSGSVTTVFDIQIRAVGTTTILASARITLYAETYSSGAVMTL